MPSSGARPSPVSASNTAPRSNGLVLGLLNYTNFRHGEFLGFLLPKE
jgi:hypothetical protein